MQSWFFSNENHEYNFLCNEFHRHCLATFARAQDNFIINPESPSLFLGWTWTGKTRYVQLDPQRHPSIATVAFRRLHSRCSDWLNSVITSGPRANCLWQKKEKKMCSCLLDALRRSAMIQSWLWGHPDRLDHRTIDLVSAKNWFRSISNLKQNVTHTNRLLRSVQRCTDSAR